MCLSLTIPHCSIEPLVMLTVAASVPVELLDSSDSIDDRLLMCTLSDGRLEEGLRSKIQEKTAMIKKLRASARPFGRPFTL